MREKKSDIHFRATPEEKTRIVRNADRAGLSLSEYLRKLALGYRPKEQPPLEYNALIRTMSAISAELRTSRRDGDCRLLTDTLLMLQRVCTAPERSGTHGGDKDMGG